MLQRLPNLLKEVGKHSLTCAELPNAPVLSPAVPELARLKLAGTSLQNPEITAMSTCIFC